MTDFVGVIGFIPSVYDTSSAKNAKSWEEKMNKKWIGFDLAAVTSFVYDSFKAYSAGCRRSPDRAALAGASGYINTKYALPNKLAVS
jgi:hypothetical protein